MPNYFDYNYDYNYKVFDMIMIKMLILMSRKVWMEKFQKFQLNRG